MTPELILPIALLASSEPAATAIEEIVVTADLRQDTTLTEFPVSVSVLDRETIREAGEQHFRELMHLVPNLNWSSASNRPRFFQMRGIGERSQYEGAPNPSVGFLIDDIDFSGIGTVATLFDVDRVEVLRGPQGTRYGANALAGLVYVRTADPEFAPSSRLEAGFGEDGIWSLGYSVTGPLGDRSAYRLALHQYQGDGFRTNDFLNVDDSNERDEFSARAKLRWQPDDDLQIDLTLLAADIDNGFDVFAPENTLTVHSDKPGRDAQDSTGVAVRVNGSGGERADWMSITTWADSDILYSFDGDWGNDDYWGEFSPYDFTSDTLRQRRTLSQELRWVSKPGAEWFDGRTEWLAGIYVLDLNEDNGFLDLFNGELFRSLDSRYTATSAAVFGQLDTRLDDDWALTTGLRYERRQADYRDSAGLDLSPSDGMLGGQVSLIRQLAPGRSAYLTLSRGYKAGGFNLGLSLPEDRREFEPEYLVNAELGVKGRFLEGRLDAAVSLFHARRRDMQVGTSFQVDPTDPLTFVFFTDNAASGTNQGIEANASYRLDDRWQLFGSVGLLEATFDDFRSPERDLAGRDQAHAPGYQVSLGAEYRSPGGWFARVDTFAQDDFYFSDSHDQVADAYQLVHLKLGYETERWSVYAWGRNVTDEVYATRGFFFGLEPPDYPNRLYTQQGDPRHVGVTARIRF